MYMIMLCAVFQCIGDQLLHHWECCKHVQSFGFRLKGHKTQRDEIDCFFQKKKLLNICVLTCTQSITMFRIFSRGILITIQGSHIAHEWEEVLYFLHNTMSGNAFTVLMVQKYQVHRFCDSLGCFLIVANVCLRSSIILTFKTGSCWYGELHPFC